MSDEEKEKISSLGIDFEVYIIRQLMLKTVDLSNQCDTNSADILDGLAGIAMALSEHTIDLRKKDMELYGSTKEDEDDWN